MNIAVVPTSSTLAVQARQYAGPDLERRDRFVLDCPDATFFHRIGWCEIFESVFHNRTHYLLAERGVEIVGVLPLVQLKGLLFGHSQQSLPFAVYGGPATLDADARTALQRMAVELGCELGVEYLELPNRSPGEPPWHGCNQDATFCKNLLPKVEANMLASPRKRRTLVRKVIQRELRSEIDSSTDRFFELYACNQHRYGTTPQSRRCFEALKRVFGDDCELLTVMSPKGKEVSGALSFYFLDEVLPYYAGDQSDARDLAANDFKYWELIRRACERGLKVFDHGRSKRGTGAFDFKMNWGFEPEALHHEYALFKRDSVPQNNSSNSNCQQAIKIWRRLPRRVVNAVGPLLARHLG